MTPDRWQRVVDVYQAAVAQPETARATFLAETCGDDVALLREVESLLAQEEGVSVHLFETRVGGPVDGVTAQQYAVARDGQRFLMNTVADQAPTPIRVRLNWRGSMASSGG